MGWEKGRTSELDPLPVLSASSLLAGCPELHGKEGNTIIYGHTPFANECIHLLSKRSENTNQYSALS